MEIEKELEWKGKNLSEHDKAVIRLLSMSTVAGQEAKYTNGEGVEYTARSYNHSDDITATTIKRENRILARVYYDHDSGDETFVIRGGD